MTTLGILFVVLGTVACFAAPAQSGIIDIFTHRSYEHDVKFFLLTKERMDAGDMTYHPLDPNFNANNFKGDGFDQKVPTKIIIHGYSNDAKSDVVRLLRKEYHTLGRYNIIAVDWSPLAEHELYALSVAYVPGVAGRVADLIDFLVYERLVDKNRIHVIGHSVGAHIAGQAAKRCDSPGLLGRITGLDPAQPSFDIDDEDSYLTSDDAKLVDVIHTSSSYLSMDESIGHIDFYPNGGEYQPGCSPIDVFGECSHGRSYELFAESIRNPRAFLGYHCANRAVAMKARGMPDMQEEDAQDWAVMGEFLEFRLPGAYYLETKGTSPFSLTNETPH